MIGNKNHRQAGQSIFMSSIIGLANTLAVVAAILGTPPLYGHTIGLLQGYITKTYGAGLEDLTSICWFFACACLVFFTSRASISTALVMGGLAIAARMF